MSAFPEGFAARAVAKVVGLVPANDRTHAAIWAAFSALQNTTLNYQFATVEQVFPPRKPKSDRRTGLMEEDYEPPGILKANWMVKHSQKVPAVVLVFHDALFESADWPRHQEEIVATIKKLGAAAGGRKTRIMSVFLRPGSQPPANLEERVMALRSACVPFAKYSVILLNTADLEPAVVRLDGSSQDLARQYCTDAQSGVQENADLLNPSTEKTMMARYAFKMGYFCEQRHDYKDALQLYRLSYKNIRELTITPARLAEIKAVAGLVSAKICFCLFQLQQPLDALRESREHIAFYRSHPGRDNQLFLAEAWLAQQYIYLANLFADNAKAGLIQPLSTQHPGFYFRLAAQHTVARRRLADKHCIDARLRKMKARTTPSAYFGKLEIDVDYLPDDAREPSDFRDHLFVCALEVSFAHSETIIALLNAALVHFRPFAAKLASLKTSGKGEAREGHGREGRPEESLRVIASINTELGQELVHIGQHEQAAGYLDTAIEMYRHEPWPHLRTAVLLASLRSAYTSGSIETYVRRALELSGRVVARTVAERTLSQSNFMRVIQNHEPSPEAGLKSASEAWSRAKAPSLPMLVDMTDLKDVIDCKVCFAARSGEAHSTITLFVVLFSHLPLPLTFDTIRVGFNSPSYKAAPLQCDGASPETEQALVPATAKVLVVTLPTMASSAHVLKVKSVSIQLGDPARQLQLSWKIATDLPKHIVALNSPTKERLESMPFAELAPQPVISIVARHTKLAITLKHAPPALVQERHTVTAVVSNGEADRARDVRLRIRLMDTADPPQALTLGTVTLASEQSGSPTSEVVATVGDIAAGGEALVSFVLCFAGPLTCNLQLHAEYHAAGAESLHVKDLTAKIECVVPFEVSFHLETLAHNKIDYIHDRLQPAERVLLLPEVRSLVPWAVEVVRCELRLRDSDAPYPYLLGDSPDVETVLESGEVLSRCFCLALPNRAEEVPLGLFALYWRRASPPHDGSTFNRTLYSLPNIAMAVPTLAASLTSPCTAEVGSCLPLTYTITNFSSSLQELEAVLEVNESFMCSGAVRSSIRIQPAMCAGLGAAQPSTHKLSFQLYPLAPGPALLPNLLLTDKGTNTPIVVTGDRHIFAYCRTVQASSA
eukprot:m.238257 g.238257  ORF g.238257 m.238257 type:complete len:1119 (+) comp21685_c0_seq1:209-3565(+)